MLYHLLCNCLKNVKIDKSIFNFGNAATRCTKVTCFLSSSRKISFPSREIISLSLRFIAGSVQFSARFPIIALVTGERSSKQCLIKSFIPDRSGIQPGFRSPELVIMFSGVFPSRSKTRSTSFSSLEVNIATQSPGRNSRDASRSTRVASGISRTISQHCLAAKIGHQL